MSVTRSAAAKSVTLMSVRLRTGLRSSPLHAVRHSKPSRKKAGSASMVYSCAIPGVAGPAGEGTRGPTATFTQLSGCTGDVVSNTTRSGDGGNRS
jgi:hypothetical protein